MNIVFMGTPDFAVNSLIALVRQGMKVNAVITQPDRPKGRGRKVLPCPVKKTALELGLTVYQPESIKEESFIDIMKDIKPDFVIVAAFGRILPKSLLDLPRFGCINVHASLLPKYRGAAPIQRAIMSGEKETGITIMKMDQGLDTGDILLQAVTPIFPQENFGSLYDRLSQMGADLLVEAIEQIYCGKLKAIPQNPKEATYAPPLTRDDEIINWNKPAGQINNKIRSLDPWPGARTKLDKKIFKIWKTGEFDENYLDKDFSRCAIKEGQLVNINGLRIIVKCGDIFLEVLEVQLEGGKRMDIKSFLRGIKINSGTVLGQE